eukprot:jgi/Mesvir1/6412/Mv19504-RA.1
MGKFSLHERPLGFLFVLLSLTCLIQQVLSAPVVQSASIVPTSGGTVVITGTGFGTTQTLQLVVVGVVPCSNYSVTIPDTEITCTIGPGTGSSIAITVQVAGVMSQEAYVFSYGAPTVASVTSSTTAGGPITVTGTNYGPFGPAFVTSVTIGGAACVNATVTVNHTVIQCNAPKGVGVNLDVVVTISELGSNTSGAGMYSYLPPAVTGAVSVSFGGGVTTLTGTSFGPVGSAYLGNVTVTSPDGLITFPCANPVVVTDSIAMNCTMQKAASADLTIQYGVTVIVAGQSSGTSGLGVFKYIAPTITGVSTISHFGGLAYITGSFFGPAGVNVTMRVNTLLVTTGVNSALGGIQTVCNVETRDVRIQCTMPAYSAPGIGIMNPSITISIPAIMMVSTNTYTGFSYDGPTIEGLSSGSQFGGDTITITGRNFVSGLVSFNAVTAAAGITSILINGADVTSTRTVVNATAVTVTNPASPLAPRTSQAADIVMIVNGLSTGSSGNGKFKFLGPLITSIRPPPTGGGVLTISGQRFGPLTTTVNYLSSGPGIVVCKNLACTQTLACTGQAVTTADVTMKCTLEGGVIAGTDIKVTINGLTDGGSGARKFSYEAPVIMSVTGNPPTSGGPISLSGTSFGPTGSTYASLTVDGLPCANPTVTVAHSAMTCTAPEGTGDEAALIFTLTSAEGLKINSRVEKILQYLPPAITSSNIITTGPGTRPLIITGTNLGPLGCTTKAIFKVGILNAETEECTSVCVTVAHTQMTCMFAGQGRTGTGRSIKLSINGQSAPVYLGLAFQPPTITGVTTAPSMFGGTLMLSGTNFGIDKNRVSVAVTGDGLPDCVMNSVTNHAALSCEVVCLNPCNLAVRDVTVTVDGQTSGTTGAGILRYIGPSVTSVNVTSWIAGAGYPVYIHGNNFGNEDLTGTGKGSGDNSVVDFVKICPLATVALCNAGNAWIVATGPGVGGKPKVIQDDVKIEAHVPSQVGAGWTVLVQVSGVDSGTSGERKLDFRGPVITSFTTLDTPGGLVTISGHGFGTLGGSNMVSVTANGNPNIILAAGCLVTVSGAVSPLPILSKMTCIVPPGVGTLAIVITMSNGLGKVLASEPANFKYNPPTVISATSAPQAGGYITVIGTNFGPVSSAGIDKIEVYVGSTLKGVCAPFNMVRDHVELRCSVPGSLGASLGLVVYIGGQSSGTTGAGKVGYDGPTILSVDPIPTDAIGSVNGVFRPSAVTIHGFNFGAVGPLVTPVVIGGKAAPGMVTVLDTVIEVPWGAGSGTDYDVVVSINGQSTGPSGDGIPAGLANGSGVRKFRYYAPIVTGYLQPVSYFGGQETIIVGEQFGCVDGVFTGCLLPVGSNFTAVDVTIGDLPCTNARVTKLLSPPGHGTQITCVAPGLLNAPLGITAVDVVVTVTGQSSGTTGVGKYAYVGPSITNVSEASIFGGKVVVMGRNFGPVGAANIQQVIIAGKPEDATAGGLSATVTVENTQIEFNAPPGTGTRVNLAFVIAGVSTGTSGFGMLTFRGPRVISAGTLPTTGGELVVVGANMGPVGSAHIMSFTVNGTPCANARITVWNIELRCTVPPGVGTNYDVLLTVTDSQTDGGTGARKFSYLPPTVTDISPRDAPPGTNVTITGTNFGPVVAGVVATIGSRACLDLVMTVPHTTLTCRVAQDTGAQKDVRVSVGGQSSPAGVSFSFLAPIVNQVSSAESSGGLVVILGKNFGERLPDGTSPPSRHITNVTIGGRLCGNPWVSVEDIEIRCSAPPGTRAALDVVVNINNQGSGTSGAGKFYYAAAGVNSFTPTVAIAGEWVTLSGTNFGEVPGDVEVWVDMKKSPNISYVTPHRVMRFAMPYGVGVRKALDMRISGRTVTWLQEARISWAPPVINLNTSTFPPTQGGEGIVGGTGFGPVGRAYIEQALVNGKSCANPEVVTADVALRCTFEPGSGNTLSVVITVGGQSSNATAFRYANPVVTSVTPTLGAKGTRIEVRGRNFGSKLSDITVLVGTVPTLANATTLVTAHTYLTATVANNVGAQLPVSVVVRGIASISSQRTPSFSYPAPFISAASSIPTTGGNVTIDGLNFGLAGPQYKSMVQSITVTDATCNLINAAGSRVCSAPCLDGEVIVESTRITCKLGAGMGTGLDVQVVLQGASSGNSGDGKLSFQRPNVTSAVPVPLYGGFTIITGTNFGLPGSDLLTVRIGGGDCTDAAVLNHTAISCRVPAGLGNRHVIYVKRDGLDVGNTNLALFAYEAPVLSRVTPTVQSPGENNTLLRIYGRNCGGDASTLRVFVGTRECPQSSLRLFPLGPPGSAEECEVFALTPPGAGTRLPVVFEVGGVRSEENPNVTFSYTALFINGTTAVPTSGGQVTITGGNFGPAGDSLERVTIGGLPCTSARVTIANTQIKCNLGPGVGGSLDVFVKMVGGMDGNDTTMEQMGVGMFSYEPPTVLSVAPRVADTWANVTVIGTNFGTNASLVEVFLEKPADESQGIKAERFPAQVLNITAPHTRLVARIGPGQGTNLRLVVSVAGQESAPPTISDGGEDGQRFSYKPPVVTSATRVGTQGGSLYITGSNLGAEGAGADSHLVSVTNRATGGTSVTVPCASPKVTEGARVLECRMPAGSGGKWDVLVIAGGQTSGLSGREAFSYLAPVLSDFAPLLASKDVIVNISGANFGSLVDDVAVWFGPYKAQGASVGEGLSDGTVTLVAAHEAMRVRVPLGAGFDLPIVVEVKGQRSDGNDSVAGTNETLFAYVPPAVAQILPASTRGGIARWKGTGFGPLGSSLLAGATVGGLPCANATVVAPDTEMTCVMPAGEGGGYDVLVAVAGQNSTGGAGLYSYAVPTVVDVSPSLAWPGAWVQIRGDNFGRGRTVTETLTVPEDSEEARSANSADVTPTGTPGLVSVRLSYMVGEAAISVQLGAHNPCTKVRMVTPHDVIKCWANETGIGRDQIVTVTVAGVRGADADPANGTGPPVPRFSFRRRGCMDVEAANFDGNATEDDPVAPCRFLGCMESDKANYWPKATEDDGSCLTDPLVIIVRVGVPFDKYMADRASNDAQLVSDVASVANTTAERLTAVDHREGSTVISLNVSDSVEQRATVVVSNFRQAVIENRAELAFPLLSYTGPDREVLLTPAAQPRVSKWSIIGVAIGVAVLLAWGIYWRRSIAACLRRGRSTRPEKLGSMNGHGGHLSSSDSHCGSWCLCSLCCCGGRGKAPLNRTRPVNVDEQEDGDAWAFASPGMMYGTIPTTARHSSPAHGGLFSPTVASPGSGRMYPSGKVFWTPN